MKVNHVFMVLIVGFLSACSNIPTYNSFDEYPVYEGMILN